MLEELLQKFGSWKTNIEAKGLRVNMGKTKILCSSYNANKPIIKSKFPCSVCNKGVGRNSILCNGCNKWFTNAAQILKES